MGLKSEVELDLGKITHISYNHMVEASKIQVKYISESSVA